MNKIIYNTYPVAFQTPGGGEIQIENYYKTMKLKGFCIDLFDIWKTKLDDYSLLHFFSCMGGSHYFTEYVKSCGIPYIVSPNLWITNKTKNNYPSDLIYTQLLHSERIICNSIAECDLLSETFSINRDRFEYVYNGVADINLNMSSGEYFKQKFGIHRPYFLTVANIEPRKNQLNLVNIMSHFKEFDLIFIGNIRDVEYARLCFNTGANNIKYLGYLPNGSLDLISAYAGCELFVLPSLLETPGLAALEAAAQGARIVITEEGATREYFGNIATYINPNVSSSIKHGIELSLNIDLCKIYINNFIRQRYAWNITLERMSNIYLEYVSK